MSESSRKVTCMIRDAQVEDAETILDLEKSVFSEREYFIALPEELEKTPIQKQRQWIRNILENEKETLIVAKEKGVVVGWIVFKSQEKKRLSHTGSITMLVSKNFRGMGIGEILLKALLSWAEKNPFVEKVSLGVFSNNHRAISLYKKMGFLEEGRKIKEFKLSEHEYIDDILMCKFV
ncbi:GNAT family N-acetyltransferase [Aeromicrobium ponti]|uniref:Ribosomal protein S18 acetylase RimI-like enzyme n=1 Tax=Cytobacillus oceanisediminis TaxID=665099 RepID=A0A562K5Y6_9BACI|nr:N-acetyltransferase [Cytobacillus oceanisediminis]TWH90817.1 ribosomal protein S18 acetylase RimI-like enzyme [Cytobacillus oceanisediminis]